MNYDFVVSLIKFVSACCYDIDYSDRSDYDYMSRPDCLVSVPDLCRAAL